MKLKTMKRINKITAKFKQAPIALYRLLLGLLLWKQTTSVLVNAICLLVRYREVSRSLVFLSPAILKMLFITTVHNRKHALFRQGAVKFRD
ncbi:hypothetical protein SAMN05216436_106135 [bacterium A37T11]|nr:hypothetical protein SAMN05216436_106135 [bacterium A37T11]